MTEYFSQYFKLLRSGFLKESYTFLLLGILLFTVFGSKISIDVEIIIFTFLGMGIFSDLDEKRYTLASSLPMKLKTRIRMLYINTYVICLLGGGFMQLAYLIRGKARSITETLIVILASVIGCNLYYLIFASNEFKEEPQEQTGLILAIAFILTIAAMILSVIYLVGGIEIISYFTKHFSITYQIVFIAILTLLTVIINYVSYKRVTKKAFISD